jgi:hypothetical protein
MNLKSFLAPALLMSVLLMTSGAGAFAQAENSIPAPSPSDPSKISYNALTPEEREIINNGRVSDVQYVAGGIIGTVVGFGVGHAIEGRYMPLGLVFTVGEVASYALIIAGLVNCVDDAANYSFYSNNNSSTTTCNHTAALTIGLVGFIGLRLWEIVDVWAAPPSINRRYDNLKEHVNLTSTHFFVIPTTPTTPAGTLALGGELGVQFRF